MLVLVVVATVLSVLLVSRQGTSGAAKEEAPPGAQARAMCQQFIKQRLHDPKSVEWVEPWTWPTKQSASGWVVNATYRATNGFNAVRVERSTCSMEVLGNDWRLVGPL